MNEITNESYKLRKELKKNQAAVVCKVPYPPQSLLGKNIMIVEKKIKWRGGEGDRCFGEEKQDLKNGCVEEYQVVGNFIHPRKKVWNKYRTS